MASYKLEIRCFIYLFLYYSLCHSLPVDDQSNVYKEDDDNDTQENKTINNGNAEEVTPVSKNLSSEPDGKVVKVEEQQTKAQLESVKKNFLTTTESTVDSKDQEKFSKSRSTSNFSTSENNNNNNNNDDGKVSVKGFTESEVVKDLNKLSSVPDGKTSSPLPGGDGQIPHPDLPPIIKSNENDTAKNVEVEEPINKQPNWNSASHTIDYQEENEKQEYHSVPETVVEPKVPIPPQKIEDSGMKDVTNAEERANDDDDDLAKGKEKLEETLKPNQDSDYVDEQFDTKKESLSNKNKNEDKLNSETNQQIYENTGGDQRNNFDTTIQKDVDQERQIFPNENVEIYDDANSHFFAYFLTMMVMTVLFYLLFHNKQRIIALMIEGRGGRPTRRSTRAKYHKLDNNLEEAMSSTRGGNGGLGRIY